MGSLSSSHDGDDGYLSHGNNQSVVESLGRVLERWLEAGWFSRVLSNLGGLGRCPIKFRLVNGCGNVEG